MDFFYALLLLLFTLLIVGLVLGIDALEEKS